MYRNQSVIKMACKKCELTDDIGQNLLDVITVFLETLKKDAKRHNNDSFKKTELN